jgi:hypothetical protein
MIPGTAGEALYALVLVVNCVVLVAYGFGRDSLKKGPPDKRFWLVPLATSMLFFIVAPNPAIAAGCIAGVMSFRFISAVFTTPFGGWLFAKAFGRFRRPPKRVNRYEKRAQEGMQETGKSSIQKNVS